jgi:pimeloyl-ACP methyl ester carboxylesterase/membrane protease YdiL (CAAX protease family)
MTEGNLFLQAARQGRNGVWRYLVTLVMVSAISLLSTGIVLGWVFLSEHTTSLDALSENGYLLVAMLPFLFVILGLWACLRLLHRRSLSSLVHPAGRLRWSNIFLSAGAWFALSGLSDLAVYLVDPSRYSWSFDPAKFFSYALLALVLVPIQTSTEELLFRGYLTQGTGLLSRGILLIPLVIPSLIFGLLHSWNPEVAAYGLGWMLLNYVGVGLLLGYVTLKSQGLELALGLHAANNLYGAWMVTFPSSAIRSPSLFTLHTFDPKLGVLSLMIMTPVYLLLVSRWKRGAAWRLAVVLAVLLSACVPTARLTTQAPAASIPLQDCRLSSAGFPVEYPAQCGKLDVFENPQAQTGRKISLHIAVIPASSQNKAADPLFLLAGGPGQAASEAFVPMLSALDRVHFKRDLVLVDQRGTGQSHALRCPATKQGDAAINENGTPDQQLAELDRCLKSLDADPQYYTTDIAMQDLDQVRKALGYEKVNLLGVSYGTRTALMYLRLFPEQVRTVILDSVVPVGWNLGDTGAADAQHAFDLMVKRCQAEASCQAAFPNTSQEFSTLLDSLEKKPVEVTLSNPTTGQPATLSMTRTVAALTVRLMLYSSEFTSLLPLIIHQAAEGDLKPLAAQNMVVAKSFSDAMSDGMYLSVICSEDVPFYGDRTAAPKTDFDFSLEDVKTQCQHWPHQDQNVSLRQPFQSSVPVLLMSGEADPVTPPANAEEAAKMLPNSQQVVVPGMGHNVLYRGCLPKVIENFLEMGKTEGLALACAATIQPDAFFLNYSGPKP